MVERFLLRVLAAVFAATFASGVPVALTLASPTISSAGGSPCLSGNQVTATRECQRNFAIAVSRWPAAKPAFSGAISGNGEWLVLDNDGQHFDEISIRVDTGVQSLTAPTPKSSRLGTMSQVVDALAQYWSGSGHMNLSGWGCGSYPGWTWRVAVTTWYLTYLAINMQGYLHYCYYAATTALTPYVTGAGSWTFYDGITGNYTTNTNPWINWYGSNILLCCSVTAYERAHMDAWGNWSWSAGA